MSVLILKNVLNEGPGTLEDFLRDNSIKYRIIEMSLEKLPLTGDIETLVILGGHMSANDTDIYPYITKEIELVKEFIGKGKKILGICLGAQIMAKALGARVYDGADTEIGWYDIELHENSLGVPMIPGPGICKGTEDFWKKLKVFQWHGETFDLPAGTVRIARSTLYQNQAFRYGRNAYAFQFHIEVSKEMIFEWFRNKPVDMDRIKKETEAFYEDYFLRATNFYNAFF